MRSGYAFFAVGACALPLSLFFAGCGGDAPAEPEDAGTESGSDARPKMEAAAPVPYVPKEMRCAARTASDAGVADSAPPPFDAAVTDAAIDGRAPEAGSTGHLGSPRAVSSGGVLLNDPTIVAISFPNDDLVDEIEDFVASIGCTPYWRAATSEYGVHEALAGRPVRLTEAAPGKIDDAQIQKWLAAKLEKHDPAFDPPKPGMLYAIYYPSGTVITEGGSQSCQQFGGYHSDLVLGDGTQVAYTVLPRCDSFGALYGIDALTGTSTHEFTEAVTDPYPIDAPAFQLPDDDHLVWGILLGGEVGDLCVNVNERSFFAPPGYSFVVQRTWSNASALAGHDPCVPNAPGAYFQAVPRLTDDVTVTAFGPTLRTKGVIIGLNASKTIELNLYSDAPTSGPWTVSVHDGSQRMGLPPSLTFALDKTTGSDGDTIRLTIFKKSVNPDLGAEPFEVTSRIGSRTNTFYGLVGH